MDTRDAQPLYKQVLAFYRNMGMPHPEEPPFMLVDAFTLNDYSNREGKDVSGGPVFHVRGLTLATVYRSIPSIVRAVGGQGGLGVSSVATALPGAERVMCDVSAILVLYGLPRLLTGKTKSRPWTPTSARRFQLNSRRKNKSNGAPGIMLLVDGTTSSS